MSRSGAAALVLAAAALLSPAPAGARAAPAPGELWSEFPLEPSATTTSGRAATTPASEKPGRLAQPVQAEDADNELLGRRATTWVLMLFGAAVVACAASLLAGVLQTVGPRDPVERRRPSRPAGRTTWVPIRDHPVALVPAQTVPTVEAPRPPNNPAPPSKGTDSRSEVETPVVCEIAAWRGYVMWQFYAASEFSLGQSFSSEYFRAPGKGAPEMTDAALQAYDALTESLIAAGWEPAGRGNRWFSERFQARRAR